ncbi:hypothetical protein ALHIDCOG_00085 [Klebsiella phage CPRSB]|nr:hypothetical protein ALHIDCOG_00085 [Klebsiella phage CPRSB]
MNLNHECLKDLSDGNEIGNVIFLDIDGVLNNMRCMKFGEHMDIECARHLRRIVNHANCDIVISSTWRIGNSTHNLREIFYPWGLYRIIGKTCTNFPHSTGMRGDEIKAWIILSDVKTISFLMMTPICFLHKKIILLTLMGLLG